VLDLKGRKKVAPFLEPIAKALGRVGFTPTGITILGLLVSVGGAVLIGFGRLSVGAAVAGLGVFLDVLDGPMARAAGTATVRGAFIDTMSDRIGEIGIWTGLAVYLREEPLGLVLCLLSLAFSLLIPYIRARAESWGADGRGGWMGRAERMLLSLFGVGFAGFGLPVMYPMLWIFAVLTALTVAQRIRRTWQQLPG
jgi:CDP-diacylglycerol--glycerol-3-phosphate 3-phosphatidyltransferase